MAAKSIAAELLSNIDSDFTTDVRYLSEQVSADTPDFESMDIARQFWLDTTLITYYTYYIFFISILYVYFLTSDIAPDSPLEIPDDIPDYQALAYLALMIRFFN